MRPPKLHKLLRGEPARSLRDWSEDPRCEITRQHLANRIRGDFRPRGVAILRRLGNAGRPRKGSA